jgi:hypothetical protein
MGVHSLDQLLNGCVLGAIVCYVFTGETFQNYLEGPLSKLKKGGIFKSWIMVAFGVVWVQFFNLYFYFDLKTPQV